MRPQHRRTVGLALAFTIGAALACNAPGWEPKEVDATTTPTSPIEEELRPPATDTPAPTETPEATETPSGEVTGPDGCVFDSLFVADITVPDDTEMAPGETFSKVWRVRNSGTCAWGPGIQLVYLFDDQMGATGAADVPDAAPDGTVELQLDLVAPETAGSHRSTWRMRTQDGRWFGNRLFIRIIVVATPTPTVTPTATATISATISITVPQPFASVWEAMGGSDGDLGHPISEAFTGHDVVEQEFEGGSMYWREGYGATPHHVFVLTRAGASISTGTWTRHVDTWSEGDDELSCPEATLPWGPVRGFGRVWCDTAAIQLAMGNPIGGEEGSKAGFQKFAGGTLLWSSRLSYVYALLNDGTWERLLVSP